MITAIITQGLPASGKSTWSKAHISENQNWIRVNLDDLREEMFNSIFSAKNEKAVVKRQYELIQEAIDNGNNIVVDNTHLNPKSLNKLTSFFDERGVTYEIKFFEVEVGEAIRRDKGRPKPVGAMVIRRMYNSYLAPKEIVMSNLPNAIIVDVDGTVADHSGVRGAHDLKLVHLDVPKRNIIEIVKRFHKTHHIIVMSGRQDSCKVATVEWLNRHGVIPEDKSKFTILMRATNDNRKDSIVKRELFDNHVSGKFNVDFVLDDRDQVVEMWRNDLGLTCLQVSWGNF